MKFLPRIMILILLLLLINCKTNDNNKLEVEVTILNVYKTSRVDREAVVEFTIENIGTEVVSGWEVFFNISFRDDHDITHGHALRKNIEIGEVTSIQFVEAPIPPYFGKPSVPLSASVKNLNVY